MIKNRKKTEKYILSLMDIDMSGTNREWYKERFKEWSDKEFHAFMVKLRDREVILPIWSPTWSDVDITVDNNIELGDKMGCPIFEKVILPTSTDSDITYESDIKYMVGMGIYRRLVQTLDKGITVPEDNDSRDALTDQVTGSSRASKVTLQESIVMSSMGAKVTLDEYLNTRGGDLGASNALLTGILNHGIVTKDTIDMHSTGSGRTRTLKAFMKAGHIDIAGD